MDGGRSFFIKIKVLSRSKLEFISDYVRIFAFLIICDLYLRDLDKCDQLISLRRTRHLPEVEQIRALILKGSPYSLAVAYSNLFAA